MKNLLTVLIVSLMFLSCSDSSSDPQIKDTTNIPGYTLVWSDEFNNNGIPDFQKWNYDIGGHGWGNNELQYYSARPENARIENGILIIEARKEEFGEKSYTSARLVTKNKGDWTYGRFEIRAKLPKGRGTWPAIWMLPTVWNLGNGSWPDNGEIDIMEHVGYDPGWIHSSIHTKKYNHIHGNTKTAKVNFPDAQNKFHTYRLEWDEEKIETYVDSLKYYTVTINNEDWQGWPFFKDFHLILNIAVGGNWGGMQGVDDSIFPQRMEVDYVRVYKRKN